MRVDQSFPNVNTRLAIGQAKGGDVINMSPIQNSIAVIEDQAAKLKAQVQLFYPNIHELHMILQGVVKTTVNVGPVAIAQAFLDKKQPPSAKESPADGDILKRAIWELITWSGKALEKSEKIIRTDAKLATLLPFHQELVRGYTEMLAGMKSFLE